MYVTGSDAWNSQKQMSEDRIEGQKACPKSGRVYPRLSGAATNAEALFWPQNATFRPLRT